MSTTKKAPTPKSPDTVSFLYTGDETPKKVEIEIVNINNLPRTEEGMMLIAECLEIVDTEKSELIALTKFYSKIVKEFYFAYKDINFFDPSVPKSDIALLTKQALQSFFIGSSLE
jgi:hypothetical protein